MRKSGILMAMSSLPSPWGIGTMGEAGRRFIDFLQAAGQSCWQLLPLGPTGYGDSPYQSFSTFAGSPYYIDLEALVEEGLLLPGEPAAADWGSDPRRVDYARLYAHRLALLRRAFRRGAERYAGELAAFRAENADWAEDYALFMALKERFGMVCWTRWPEDIRRRQPEAVARWRETLGRETDFWLFTQVLFFRQWAALRSYAREREIRLIGDLPIYVAQDSADVWSCPQFFQLDGEGLPREVAGVPPDDFSADGQLWGNPLYDWEALRADGYGWWIRRMAGAARLYDVIRLDHFRGFESYWAVPRGEDTARRGRWRPGPGMELVGTLQGWFPELRFIAEDLGYLTPEAEKLLADSGLPGMRVLEFGFDPRGDSHHAPHHCPPHSVCYVGTHDNAPVLGWAAEAEADTLDYAREYLHLEPGGEDWCRGMLRAGMATASELFIMQMQDVLELPGWSRMNTPGTAGGNWQWRMTPDALTPALAGRLRRMTEIYRRL